MPLPEPHGREKDLVMNAARDRQPDARRQTEGHPVSSVSAKSPPLVVELGVDAGSETRVGTPLPDDAALTVLVHERLAQVGPVAAAPFRELAG
jgi:hypothetical protein